MVHHPTDDPRKLEEWGGPDEPDKPEEPAPPRRQRRPERGIGVQERERVAKPPRFKVVLYNDDYTPMEFVVALLESVFGLSPARSTQVMLHVHRNGSGVAGVYVLEVAETKVATVHRLAEERGYPLRAGVEEE
jgi:ATP-dependent Clp protease adaptor protein ClpS